MPKSPRAAWFDGMNRSVAAGYAGFVLAATAATLYFYGRDIWCKLGDVVPWTFDTAGAHLSQHILDPYSFTHVEHGILFYAGLYVIAPSKPVGWRFLAAITLACGWELLENSSFIIDKYRAQTIDAGYYGDSVINALADVGCAAIGFWFTSRFRWYWSALLLVAFEVGLAVTIRDNLLLNIIMLIYPLDAILEWQRARG